MLQEARIPKFAPRSPRLARLGVACVLSIALLSGCHTVEYYEREALASPWMQFDEDPAEIHWLEKTLFTREGSVGGVGTSAGGGCGCY